MSSALLTSQQFGENAESAVIEVVPEIEWVPDSDAEHWDGEVVDVITPDAQLPTVGLPVVGVGTEVEIKSAAVVVTQSQRSGRFQIRRQQHERLCELGAVYLFAVCEPRRQRDVLALKIVPAVVVDDLDWSWIQCAGRDDYAQFSWSQVFGDSEVCA